MSLLRRVGEGQLHVMRWFLLVGWLLLIASLLIPAINAPGWMLPACPPELAASCLAHRQPGNRLFWGTVVPLGLLLIGVVSQELLRRICPLAFVSQLARALGRQRTRPGRLERGCLFCPPSRSRNFCADPGALAGDCLLSWRRDWRLRAAEADGLVHRAVVGCPQGGPFVDLTKAPHGRGSGYADEARLQHDWPRWCLDP